MAQLGLNILIIGFFCGSVTVATKCSQPNIHICYSRTSYVTYRTMYSMESRSSSYSCGVWGWSRCQRTTYYQTSSAVSITRYRTQMSCCNGYHNVQGSCEPICSPACDAGYTCVAPNMCRRGVQLMLGGVNYPNNSVIQFDSIYFTPDHCHSLLCTTDRVPCCSNSQRGNWHHVRSNGSFINVVPTITTADYYQSRENDGTLRLIRHDNIIQSTDSFYCCQLPDASLFVQTLCVTIAVSSPGVWLSLGGLTYSNNSAIELRELFETPGGDDSHSLLCVTPKRPCCRTPPHRFGEWYYPNGSAVSIDGSGNSFFRDRGDDGLVRLHRRGVASLSAAMGRYCCEIPNAIDITHRLCVHFVDSSPKIELFIAGQKYPNNSVIQLNEVFKTSNESQSLVCATENRPCCKNPRSGEWYYPNMTIVPNLEAGSTFYTHRENDGTVQLYLRNHTISVLNISQFCCELPNINNLNQKLCAYLDPTIEEETLATVIFTTSYPIELIQLRLLGIADCYNWVHQNTLSKVEDMVQAIVEAIKDQCHCGLSTNHFTGGAFLCFQESSSRAVTYRTELLLTIPNLTEYISSWISTRPAVSINAVLLQVDNTCPFSTESFNDPECGVMTESDRITTDTSKSIFNLDSIQSNELIILIGGAIGLVVMFLVLCCCFFIIIIIPTVLLWKKLKSTKREQSTVHGSSDTTKSAEINNKSIGQFQLRETKIDPEYELQGKSQVYESEGMDMDGYEDVSDQVSYYKSLMKQKDNSVYTQPYHQRQHAQRKIK